jgi:hypothetical protein
MPPRPKQADKIQGYLPLREKHSEYLVLKNGLQPLRDKTRRHPKQTLLIKTAVGAKNMAMRVEPQKEHLVPPVPQNGQLPIERHNLFSH